MWVFIAHTRRCADTAKVAFVSNSRHLPQERQARAFVVLAAIAFATSGPLAKLSGGIPPAAVASLRTLLASLVLVGFRPRAFLRDVAKTSRRDRLRAGAAGVLLGLHFTAFIAGLALTSLPAGVALISLEPLAVIVAMAALHRVAPTRVELIGLAVATLGGIVVSSGARDGAHGALGDVLVLVAVVLYGVYVAFARGVSEALPPATYIALVYGVAGVSLVPWALASQLIAAPGKYDWPATALAATLALALVPTLVGHSLVQAAARFARPALVALVPPGETVGALIIGVLFMHVQPSTRELVGCALALCGAVLAARANAAIRPAPA